MNDELYKKGLETLASIGGKKGTDVIDQLKNISPDLSRLGVEFTYGQVYSRPGLDMKMREVATIAALTAMGCEPGPLQAHIELALSVGLTEQEIEEIIIQMVAYVGFPIAWSAMEVAAKVFQKNNNNLIAKCVELKKNLFVKSESPVTEHNKKPRKNVRLLVAGLIGFVVISAIVIGWIIQL